MKSVFIRKLLFPSLIGAAILLSCEPKPNVADLVRKMVVVTDYNDTVSFSKKTSYYLALDTIIYFNTSSQNYPSDTLQCTTCSGYNNYLADYPTVVTNELKDKMNLAGYTKVGLKKNADIWIYPFIIENYSATQSLSYSPYGYGYGYGYYGYGGYYPTVTVSDQADLYIEIFDLKNKYKGGPNLIWLCDISDLVSSPDYYGLTAPAIDQAFKQSSYLKK